MLDNSKYILFIFLFSTIVLLSFNIIEFRTSIEVRGQSDPYNESKFSKLTDDYNQAWKQMPFQSVFSAYVSTFQGITYDVYDVVHEQERGSDVFLMKDAKTLYIEPVGFTHTEITDSYGNKLYKVSIQCNITIFSSNGSIVSTINDTDKLVNGIANDMLFHNKNTDIFLFPDLSLVLQPDNYTVKYTVKDVPSGKSFDIVKQIKIVTDKEFCLMPVNRERSDCKQLESGLSTREPLVPGGPF